MKFPKRINLWLVNFRRYTGLLKLEKTLEHLPYRKKAENLKKLYIIIEQILGTLQQNQHFRDTIVRQVPISNPLNSPPQYSRNQRANSGNADYSIRTLSRPNA